MFLYFRNPDFKNIFGAFGQQAACESSCISKIRISRTKIAGSVLKNSFFKI